MRFSSSYTLGIKKMKVLMAKQKIVLKTKAERYLRKEIIYVGKYKLNKYVQFKYLYYTDLHFLSYTNQLSI